MGLTIWNIGTYWTCQIGKPQFVVIDLFFRSSRIVVLDGRKMKAKKILSLYDIFLNWIVVGLCVLQKRKIVVENVHFLNYIFSYKV